MSFTHEPAAAATPISRMWRLLGRALLVFLLTAALDVAFGFLAFYIATRNHGRGGLNPEWVTAASAFLLGCMGLQLFLVVALVRRNGYAQGAAAMVGLIPLGMLLAILCS